MMQTYNRKIIILKNRLRKTFFLIIEYYYIVEVYSLRQYYSINVMHTPILIRI